MSCSDRSSHAQQLPWGAKEGKAEFSSSNIHAVSTKFIKGRKKGLLVKSLLSKTLVSVPASATLQSQASHMKTSGLLWSKYHGANCSPPPWSATGMVRPTPSKRLSRLG